MTAASSHAIIIAEWTARISGTLRGFCTVQFPSGAIFHQCSVFEKDGRWWASPAGKPMAGRDGTLLKDEITGKTRYSPVVSFADKTVRNRWSDQVIAALHAAHPELLG